MFKRQKVTVVGTLTARKGGMEDYFIEACRDKVIGRPFKPGWGVLV